VSDLSLIEKKVSPCMDEQQQALNILLEDQHAIALVIWSKYSGLPLQVLFSKLLTYALEHDEALSYALQGAQLSEDFTWVRHLLQQDGREREKQHFESVLGDLSLDALDDTDNFND